MLLQTNWASNINPVLTNPLVNGIILSNVKLVTGDNAINHKLGRKLQGWFTVLSNAAVSLYDKQSTNKQSNLTLILNSSGPATVSLYVF
jgi:hypothetical protein